MQSGDRRVQSGPQTPKAPAEAGGCGPSPIRETSGPLVRPPILYACSVLSGLVLDWIWPLGLPPSGIQTSVGQLLVGASIVLFASSVREFWRFATPVPSSRPSRTVVRTGPYRLSRNPIYLAFTSLQLGIALWTDNAWLLALLVPTLAVLSRGVIAREERYLADRFGEEYLRYRRSVRRWL